MSAARHHAARLAMILGVVLAAIVGAASDAPLRRVKDMDGRELSLPPRPQRVVSLCTSATDTIVRLGETQRLAGIDEHGKIIPGASDVPSIGRAGALSRESILAVRADLAFVWWYQTDVQALFEAAGTPCVRIRCGRATEVGAALRLVGECLGCPDKAALLARQVEEFLAAASSRAPAKPRTVYLELYGPFRTSGAGTLADDLIRLAGGLNVAADASGSVLLSQERLLLKDPEVVLVVGEFTSPRSFRERNGMAALRAVRENRVRSIDRYLLVAGAGLPQAVETLRKALTE
ncbi:MAG TPA: ABC transporter substrate-binding protein [Vicinamibacterales bacterium]|nr:ABC transporter substrate-binding protein [Vicinamibacterales bacterium]